MWIFTKYGFLNAVGARQGNGSHGQPVDPDTMMIRARFSARLQALQERFPEHLAETEIQKTTGTDYAFRIFIPKTTWVTLLVAIGMLTACVDKSRSAWFEGPWGFRLEAAIPIEPVPMTGGIGLWDCKFEYVFLVP